MINKGVDKIFLGSAILLTFLGFAVFLSASMGILAKNSTQFSSVAFKQAFLGLFLGFIACFLFSKINYKILRKYSLFIFIGSLILTALVFIPSIGEQINGAKRWIYIAGLSFQPIFVLNIGFIIYWAAWLAMIKEKVTEFKNGLLPFLILLSLVGVVLLFQPDTDSFVGLVLTGSVMFLVAGGKIKHFFILILIGCLGLTFLAFSRPYIMARIQTYINPSENSLTSSYQLQQSLIAIGSGKITGRGFGQGIQKFKFLPESMSDSVFAVVGEEFGFLGCVIILLLFLFFIFRGVRISIRSPDQFGGLLVIGIVILITSQTFMNIASNLGIIPISGLPMAFFSQGGTALLATLAEIGIVLNVSKHQNKIK